MKPVTFLTYATSAFTIVASAEELDWYPDCNDISFGGPTTDGGPGKDTNGRPRSPTYCDLQRDGLTPEQEIKLGVLFGDGKDGTTFADYVVVYASELVEQIEYVARLAIGGDGYSFTTAFDVIDTPGVLGLASAGTVYPCFLSTLWAQALSNPQQYAKGGGPVDNDEIKLTVLFEKRLAEGLDLDFNYAEFLAEDTDYLLREVQKVANIVEAGNNDDPAGYLHLYDNLDVVQLLSMASQAPIYTEGLSAAFASALKFYGWNTTVFPGLI